MSPEGATPVLIEEDGPAIPGADVIAEYLDETRGFEMGERRLMPDDAKRAGPVVMAPG